MTIKQELEKVNQLEQRQDSTLNQLKDLVIIAEKFGLYDASDLIKTMINNELITE